MTDPAELDAWRDELLTTLGIEDLEVDVGLVLELAKHAAHGVARPAAPLTTFLVGYAAGRRGGGEAAVQKATEEALSAVARRREA
ncbi:DUF6457 domain-containing protein [Herbiconiux sp. SYSU D00978]|uniref:DUF6457 domain-containing protein n=1 Tax=Herbiconiux sp. SYSU D00978 TaxID=2812562 RepID=UPI001A971720|nr:DUF6457 domain-containing protein [Herbiconiux sp. SYSU D00978]